jgi:Rod binding domain-containing protein
MADALPSIDSALIPASVRAAGPEAQKLYTVALSFEQLLTQKVAQALSSTLHDAGGDSSGSDSDGSDSGGDASTSMVEQMLPNALAQGVSQAGGLGLAAQLYEALGGPAAPASAAKAGA